VTRHIRLRGVNGAVKGRVWESTALLRIGRLDSLEIVLDDTSVSRQHAKVEATDRGWRISDLNSTNGTRLNGVKLGQGQWPLRVRDTVQVGEVALVVESLDDGRDIGAGPGEQLRVEATANATWEEALHNLAFDTRRCPRPGEQLFALLRAGHHLGHLESEEDLLQEILNDAVIVLDAQRGAIVLADGPNGVLRLRAAASGRGEPRAVVGGRSDASVRVNFSQSIAQRCFNRGESILCQNVGEDSELSGHQSVAEGAMASVLCVLLRTPRKRLGILHLDRSPWQKPFTMEDLHLADALAANVSAGIESAQLLRKQRELFLNTITMLAQAVELRDEYTFGHTQRVTAYSVLLAQHLSLPSAELELVRLGGPLHDIGKIGIPDGILNKPDRLTPEEFAIMKLHTVKGDEIVSTLSDLHPIRPIVRSHHERWDGTGYPDRLKGEETPFLARIVAVADAFDAMTSDRPYRKGMAPAVAFLEIEKQLGKQFDPKCASGFLQIRERILQEMRNQSTTAVIPREVRAVAAGRPATATLTMKGIPGLV
jgi:HD-GYP domain-containing protein (c-di-GMP phosphodiesterase class II)